MVKRGRVVGYVAAGAALLVVGGTLVFGGPGTSALNSVGISPLLGDDRSNFSKALDVVPAGTNRFSFTDWAIVRDALDIDAGNEPDPELIEDLVTKSYDTDFSASSTIEGSAVALEKYFGFSPATIEWEAYAQEGDGAAMVVRLPDYFDMDTIRTHLADIGFVKPAKKDGVWEGGIDLVAALDGTLTPKLQYVSVLEDERLVVTSETAEYVQRAAEVASGQKKSLGESDRAREIVDSIPEPATAQLWVDDFACIDLSMNQAASDDKAQGEALIREAGKVSPLAGLVMAMDADRTFRVAELFEDDAAAKENLQTRARLIVGEAPGIGGSFSDDLELTSSKTDGATVQLVLKPRTPTGFVLGALNQGPVLFATC